MNPPLQDLSSRTHPVRGEAIPLTGLSGLVIGGTGLMFLAAFLLAMRLDPNPSGLGTHQQLGLPPCTIRTLFKIPCPTCGMTTSFAHFVRGEWIQAARANTSGLILACFAACFLPWAAVSLIKKEYWLVPIRDAWIFWILFGWMSLVVIEWSSRHWIPFWF